LSAYLSVTRYLIVEKIAPFNFVMLLVILYLPRLPVLQRLPLFVYPDGLLNLIMQVIVGAVGGGAMISGGAAVGGAAASGGGAAEAPKEEKKEEEKEESDDDMGFSLFD
jgi:hypothetical protein